MYRYLIPQRRFLTLLFLFLVSASYLGVPNEILYAQGSPEVRLDNLQRRQNGLSSAYRITNRGTGVATIDQVFYRNDGAQESFSGDTIEAGQSLIVELSDQMFFSDFDGYVIIASDQPIEATHLPSASFVASPNAGPEPLEVTFSALTLGNVNGWLWDFGDGNTSTEVAPTHTYTIPGKHTVILTVTDSNGESYVATQEGSIEVADSASGKTQISGLIAESTRWTVEGSPYLVTGPVLVDSGATLTLDAGVEVRFTRGTGIDVAGALVAIGAEDSPTILTSASPEPEAGDWRGIRFLDGSQGTRYDQAGRYLDGSILQHVEVSYSGLSEPNRTEQFAIDASRVTLYIDNAHFHDINVGVLHVGGGDSRVTDSRFENNSMHIYLQDGNGLEVGAVILDDGSNSIIARNVISNTKITYEYHETADTGAVILHRGDNVLIEDNHILNTTSNFSDLAAADPSITPSSWAYPSIIRSNTGTIQFNELSNNAGNGIIAGPNTDAPTTVSENVIHNIENIGIMLTTEGHFPEERQRIWNNIISGSGHGILVRDIDTDVLGNTVTGNEGIGISYSGVASGIVAHNKISGNSLGLKLTYPTGSRDNISTTISFNTITTNTVGIELGDLMSSQPWQFDGTTIELNQIHSNAAYDLRNRFLLSGERPNVANNWWGTTDLAAISAKIYDWNDDSTVSIVAVEPILTEPPTVDTVPFPNLPDTNPKPLVLIYAVLDNNLGESWRRLVNNIEAGVDGAFDVRLFIDGPSDDGDVYIYDVRFNADPFCPSLVNPTCNGRYIEGETFWRYPSEDAASPETLYQFISDAHAAYPGATQTILSLVGHGSGWSANVLPGQPRVWADQNDTLGGMLWDDHPRAGVANSNSLSTLALGNALQVATQASGKKIDLLYLDGCSMGMVEVAYELRSSTEYLLSSPNIDWASFNYNNLLPEVANEHTSEELGKRWLELEAAELRDNPGHPFTLALTDLTAIEPLATSMNSFATELQNALPASRESILNAFGEAEHFDSNFDGILDNRDNYIDLASFAQEVMDNVSENSGLLQAAQGVETAVNNIVIAKDYESGVPWVYSDQTWQWNSFGGLGVYLPLGVDEERRQLFYNQTNLTWAEATTWDEFLETFWADAVHSAQILPIPVCRATTDSCEGLANPLPEQDNLSTKLYLPALVR